MPEVDRWRAVAVHALVGVALACALAACGADAGVAAEVALADDALADVVAGADAAPVDSGAGDVTAPDLGVAAADAPDTAVLDVADVPGPDVAVPEVVDADATAPDAAQDAALDVAQADADAATDAPDAAGDPPDAATPPDVPETDAFTGVEDAAEADVADVPAPDAPVPDGAETDSAETDVAADAQEAPDAPEPLDSVADVAVDDVATAPDAADVMSDNEAADVADAWPDAADDSDAADDATDAADASPSPDVPAAPVIRRAQTSLHVVHAGDVAWLLVDVQDANVQNALGLSDGVTVEVDLSALGGDPHTGLGAPLPVDPTQADDVLRFQVAISTLPGVPLAVVLPVRAVDASGRSADLAAALVVVQGVRIDVGPVALYHDLTSAVAAAADGDALVLADGTYTGPENLDVAPLAGKRLVVVGAENALPVIDCAGASSALRWLAPVAGPVPDVLAWVRVTGCAVSALAVDAPVPGVFLAHVTLDDHSSVAQGAALDVNMGAVTGVQLHVHDNTLSSALRVVNGATATLWDTTFAHNTSVNGYGGAVRVESGTATFVRGAFTQNQSLVGGAIYLNGAALQVHGAQFTANTSSYGGGAICGGSATASIDQGTRFVSNISSGPGGGVLNTGGGTFTLTDVEFADNLSGINGGGFCGSSYIVDNALVHGNHANGYGGGASLDSLPSTLQGLTVTGNQANTSGGGLWVSGTSVGLVNSIVWGNSAASALDVGLYSSAYSRLIASFTDADFALIPVTAGTVTLGAGTLTAWPQWLDFWRLDVTSPCVDAGTTVPTTSWGTTTRSDGAPDTGPRDLGFHARW